jgi:hypothetical protein
MKTRIKQCTLWNHPLCLMPYQGAAAGRERTRMRAVQDFSGDKNLTTEPVGKKTVKQLKD